jgi:hypothetical protein
MVKVDFDEFEAPPREEPKDQVGGKPARRSRRAGPVEEEKLQRRGRKPRKASREEDDSDGGEAPLTQVADDDSELAEKLARIREKAMRIHQERARQESADSPSEEVPKAKKGAKKPARSGRKKK